MKKHGLVGALIVALMGPLAAQASDGTITFTGELTSSSCLINGGGAGGTFTVQLPKVSTATMTSAGQTAGATFFDMALTACTPGLTTAAAYFEAGPTIDSNNGRLKNSGSATNVQIRLANADGSVLNLAEPYGAQNVVPVTLVANAGVASFIAAYYATGAVAAGTVQSSVTYSMVYN